MHKFDISFRVSVGGSNKDEAFQTAWQEITKIFDDPELLLVEESPENYIDERPILILTDRDGNAFSVLGAAKKVMKEHNYDKEKIEEILNEAMSGDYTNLIATMMHHFNVQ